MAEKYVVTLRELNTHVTRAALVIRHYFSGVKGRPAEDPLCVYAVPRGGVPAALALGNTMRNLVLVDNPEEADFIFDDLIDSGATAERYAGKPFFALIDKRSWQHGSAWVVWPWEGTADGGIEDNIRRLLQYVGEDPDRGGLQETPKRVAKAWAHWTSGYNAEVGAILKTFEDGAENCDQMVVVKDISFFTHCEHHMAPFFGTATIAYLPNQTNPRIVGLSKLARLLDVYARRLQVQERLGNQIADALVEHLGADGVGVVITARHLCMESRGVARQGQETITSALRGSFRDDPTVRAEFMALAR